MFFKKNFLDLWPCKKQPARDVRLVGSCAKEERIMQERTTTMRFRRRFGLNANETLNTFLGSEIRFRGGKEKYKRREESLSLCNPRGGGIVAKRHVVGCMTLMWEGAPLNSVGLASELRYQD